MLDRYDQDLLLDYLEGELDADRRAELDEILSQDPQLAGLLSEMAMDRAALRSLPEAQAPADMVHDVTQTLERRMLLDEPVDETGPIPLSRGRGLTSDPPRSISWGRVVGLTGLAASVALAAAIVVITLDDPLERTANEFAASSVEDDTEAKDAETLGESAIAESAERGTSAKDSFADRLEANEPLARSNAAEDVPLAERLTPGGLANGPLALGQPDAPLALEGAPAADAVAAALERNRFAREQPFASRTLGTTAAISAIQSRQQLVLFTESPELSREQLFEFCVANGIPILQAGQPQAQQEARATTAAAQPVEDANLDTALDDYTLLINESQLDTLMFSLNNEAAIEPSRAGKASVFSNQAALLTDLTGEPVQDPSASDPTINRDAQQVEQVFGRIEVEATREEQAAQQAVELRLPPDLGSAYANSRNAYNLTVQKKNAGYTQLNQKDFITDKPTPADSIAPEEQKAQLAELDQAQQDKAKEAPAKPVQPLTPEPTPDDKADAAPDTNANHVSGHPQQPKINPSRGNWLAAHLPVADTTPLLLHWRTEQSVNPTKLVPVTIKRAELKDVNTLRMRQQVELADRNAKPTDDVEAAAEQTTEQPPAESAK